MAGARGLLSISRFPSEFIESGRRPLSAVAYDVAGTSLLAVVKSNRPGTPKASEVTSASFVERNCDEGKLVMTARSPGFEGLTLMVKAAPGPFRLTHSPILERVEGDPSPIVRRSYSYGREEYVYVSRHRSE